jgi:ribosomal protein S18 acetylase RimI-like enzyme
MSRLDPTIKKIELNDDTSIAYILTLQKLSYAREAQIIGYSNIPPLFDTQQTIRQSNEQFTGLYLGNELVGLISTRLAERELEICRLVVHPRHMGRNYATRLLYHIEVAQPQAKRIIVSTAENNDPALALYKKNGYKQSGKRVTSDGLELVMLEKIPSERTAI